MKYQGQSHKEFITAADLHVFGDASIGASCAVVYGVVHQESVSNQGLDVSKSLSLRRAPVFVDWKLSHHTWSQV